MGSSEFLSSSVTYGGVCRWTSGMLAAKRVVGYKSASSNVIESACLSYNETTIVSFLLLCSVFNIAVAYGFDSIDTDKDEAIAGGEASNW